jgi:hypothetical protein
MIILGPPLVNLKSHQIGDSFSLGSAVKVGEFVYIVMSTGNMFLTGRQKHFFPRE